MQFYKEFYMKYQYHVIKVREARKTKQEVTREVLEECEE